MCCILNIKGGSRVIIMPEGHAPEGHAPEGHALPESVRKGFPSGVVFSNVSTSIKELKSQESRSNHPPSLPFLYRFGFRGGIRRGLLQKGHVLQSETLVKELKSQESRSNPRQSQPFLYRFGFRGGIRRGLLQKGHVLQSETLVKELKSQESRSNHLPSLPFL